jgi:catechol 2,3-dioxygenase-like lactoylglutathione lyase family enzyme
MEVRIARPTCDLDRALAFYRGPVGLPLVASFDDHDGYSGAVLGLPGTEIQLELVSHASVEPAPTAEDQLVLYLGSADEVAERAASLARAGLDPTPAANPYWARTGAIAFVDPDGYWLILSPDSWG